jgi:nucleoside-diphosphate-sugar epimerase
MYGLSKRWGEESCRLYAPDGLIVLRLSMPYGPGLPAGFGRAAIINMLWQALNRKPIPVHIGAERSWCWVGDTVRAIKLIIEDSTHGAYNVGRDDAPVSMFQVARIACELTGAPFELIEMVKAPERQTVVKRLSTDKIRELGWTPEVDLLEGMERTLVWVESQNHTKAKPLATLDV